MPDQNNKDIAAVSIDQLYDMIYAGAIMGSGGGGSYADGLNIVQEMEAGGYAPVPLLSPQNTSPTNSGVLAFIGSPDAGESLDLDSILQAVLNVRTVFNDVTGISVDAFAPVELGALNSLIPFCASLAIGGKGSAAYPVIDCDGAGRAVPQLDETMYAADQANLPVSPLMLANSSTGDDVQAVDLQAQSATQVDDLSRGVISASFGSIASLLGWTIAGQMPTSACLVGTISNLIQLGGNLRTGSANTDTVAGSITSVFGRQADVIIGNGTLQSYEDTTSGGFDFGTVTITLGEATYKIYNQNENLIMWSDQDSSPIIVAPDSICYYSEDTYAGFSNSSNDLESYVGKRVSVIKVAADPQFAAQSSILAAFKEDLQSIGYAGKFPL